MSQIARIVVGLALVSVQVVWLFLRNQPPLSQWAPSTSAPGLWLFGLERGVRGVGLRR